MVWFKRRSFSRYVALGAVTLLMTEVSSAVGQSSGDKQAVAEQSLQRMRDVRSKVLQYIKEAKREKDIIRLNCLNEGLSAIKGLLRISEDAKGAMRDAMAQQDEETTEHEFYKITVAADKTVELAQEAESCIGEFAVYTGETDLDTEMNAEVIGHGDPFAVLSLAPFSDDLDGISDPLVDDVAVLGDFSAETDDAAGGDASGPPPASPFF